MARKVTLYLDTSIPNALFQEPEERRRKTEAFFQIALPRFEAFVSGLVLAEIEATPNEEERRRLSQAVNKFSVLPVSPEAEQLAEEYLKYLRIPRSDAVHIAVATVEGMNYLVTWNMGHMAKERTRRIVDNVNFLRALQRIFIVTPEDLLEEESHVDAG